MLPKIPASLGAAAGPRLPSGCQPSDAGIRASGWVPGGGSPTLGTPGTGGFIPVGSGGFFFPRHRLPAGALRG